MADIQRRPGDWMWKIDKASYNFYMRAYRILLRNGHKETDGIVVQVKEKIDYLIDFWKH